MNRTFIHLKVLALVFIASSKLVNASCEEKANLYRSSQSVFLYANYVGDEIHLLDREKRVYLANFHSNGIDLKKTGDFEYPSSFFHFNKRKGFSWVASNAWKKYPTKPIKTLGEKIIDFDTILNLSAGSKGATIFLGDYPKYIVAGKNSLVQLKDWPFAEGDGYFLGVYSVGDAFLVLVAHDETVNFYRSNDGYYWEKSDFSITSFVKAYTYKKVFWVVNEKDDKYSSTDGVHWQLNLHDHEFNQYMKEFENRRASLINSLRASNYVIHAFDGDQNEGILTGVCNKKVEDNIESLGFLLHYRNNQYFMYNDFDNKGSLKLKGESWSFSE